MQTELAGKRKIVSDLEKELQTASDNSRVVELRKQLDLQKDEYIKKEQEFNTLHTKLLDLEKSSSNKISQLVNHVNSFVERIQDLEREKIVQENRIKVLQKYREQNQDEKQNSAQKIADLERKVHADNLELQTIQQLLSKSQSELESARADSLHKAKLYEQELDKKDEELQKTRKEAEEKLAANNKTHEKSTGGGGDGGGEPPKLDKSWLKKFKDKGWIIYGILRLIYYLASWSLTFLFWLMQNILSVVFYLIITLIIWLIIKIKNGRRDRNARP